MKKDIFIDNNIASKFSNPQDKEYVKLTSWLLKYDPEHKLNADPHAHLVVSKKLLVEYTRSCREVKSATAIPLIIGKMQAQGRLIVITNDQIKSFFKVYFTKTIKKCLKCNNADHQHIPVVLLSNRKFVLSYDENFLSDILNFPGFDVTAAKRPELLPYE